MTVARNTSSRLMVLALVLVGTSVLAGAQASATETPEQAVRRIQAGRHVPMPPPVTAPASAPGKGMTIENGTGRTIQVHFSGPTSRTVIIADGRSESVELAVGDYDVAAEVPGSTIIPFYGRQAYQSFTHYWLRFYTQRVDPPTQPPFPSLVVTVSTDKTTATIKSATIQIRSVRGFALGSGMLTLDGFYVTDPVVPPEGIELRRTLVKWGAMKQVDFVDWNVKAGAVSFTKAMIVMVDGTSQEVFLWNPGNRDEYTQLRDADMLIIGSSC